MGREGGLFGDYRVVSRPNFNSMVLHRALNFRGVGSTDMASFMTHVYDTLNDILEVSKTLAGENGVFNITLRGESLTTDVNAMLNPENGNALEYFIGCIEKVLQSNASLVTDQSLEVTVNIARSRNGGVYRKLRHLAHDEVIKKKRMNLFIPINTTDNLCFAQCIAKYMYPQATINRLQECASDIQRRAGFTIHQKIGFRDVVEFEALLDVKIFVFYRTVNGDLLYYQNSDVPHDRTIHVYLHDEHYHGILKLNAFMGVPYVCKHCYKGDTKITEHWCKYVCNVCYDQDCYKNKGRDVYCDECRRFCHSSYCFEKHKQQFPRRASGMLITPCDVTKYCRD